jgi:hypothetical protein
MNGQGGNDAANQASQEAQLAYFLNAAGQNGGYSGYPGAGSGRLGLSDSSLEEQILQRASHLRAEALMQQQQQQRQQQLGYALAALQQQQSALQQQQQLSSYSGLGGGNLGGLGAQEQEALLARVTALRELGMSGGPAPSGYGGGGGMERLQQMELGRLEELEKRRQQLTALANLSGGGAGGARQAELQAAAELSQDSVRSASSDADRIASMASASAAEKSKEDLRKTPGTVIVPCRARGMPMDHNFKVCLSHVALYHIFHIFFFSNHPIHFHVTIDGLLCYFRRCQARRGSCLLLLCLPQWRSQVPLLCPLYGSSCQEKLLSPP